MKNYLKIFTILAISSLFTNCSQDDILESKLSNHVGFEPTPKVIEIVKNATETIDVTVAASEVSGTDRTYTVSVDESSTLAASYTVPSTVTIPANSNVGTISVTVTDDEALEYVNQTLVLSFEEEVGISFGNDLTINFTEECLNTVTTLFLTLDTWPDETTWEMYSLTGGATLIGSGGPYANPADDFAELSFNFCLESGEYGIVVYDSYGDGGPTFSVSTADGVLVAETTLAGSNSSATFTIN
ncbi:hypothetical protein HNV10_00015 [Winogradskyella litoriviva]|uniref:Calx-beta domain-containing protein n=1 Tax=Winogradskyella litoriviva TaxID=1220182 RepID=A0ABX2DYV7_9FLAO|nr:hypothetical protein [Winogradskyella litoriviva]NRD21603.1 hypothetical protein [Winogradskyella litoriviva]